MNASQPAQARSLAVGSTIGSTRTLFLDGAQLTYNASISVLEQGLLIVETSPVGLTALVPEVSAGDIIVNGTLDWRSGVLDLAFRKLMLGILTSYPL